MTDYPSIKPEDVREGDVVRWTNDGRRDQPVTMQGTVWLDENGRRWVGPFTFERRDLVVPDLRLVSRPTPPEPPLRALLAGDWVRHHDGDEWQITSIERTGNDTYAKGLGSPFPGTGWAVRSLTRIEPPVGWPVGVPTEDGGVRWYYRDHALSTYYCPNDIVVSLTWADLLAAGGVPAQAVTR